jgi:CRISPR-associated protein Csm2
MNLISFTYPAKSRKQDEWQERYKAWGLPQNTPIGFDDQTLKNIISPAGISDDESAKLLVRWADILGAFLVEHNLSTSQIRAIFSEVRQIEGQLRVAQVSDAGSGRPEKAWTRLRLLIPKMEYRKGKEKNNRGVENIVEVLKPAVKLVLDGDSSSRIERFGRFVNFFEAILAYHKSYGGN